MNNRYGFIYKEGNDFGLIMGKSVYFLSDGISDIKEDVEIGYNEKNVLNGYSFGINKVKKIWRIRDTGHNCCKEVIASGIYNEGFEESLKSFIKIFK